MEKQYTDYFGKPITKKKYEEARLRRKKRKEKIKKDNKKFLKSQFHNDGPTLGQKFVDAAEKKDPDDAVGRVYLPTKKYKTKIKNFNKNAEITEDLSMKQLMEILKQQTDKKKAKEKKETKKYGRPIKKKELEVNKGGSITKNKIGANDYRKGGYVLSTKDNRKNK